MPAKAPEPILSVSELEMLTRWHPKTLLKYMKDPQVWAVPGGAKKIGDDYFLTTSFYNRWLDSKDVASAPAKKGEA